MTSQGKRDGYEWMRAVCLKPELAGEAPVEALGDSTSEVWEGCNLEWFDRAWNYFEGRFPQFAKYRKASTYVPPPPGGKIEIGFAEPDGWAFVFGLHNGKSIIKPIADRKDDDADMQFDFEEEERKVPDRIRQAEELQKQVEYCLKHDRPNADKALNDWFDVTARLGLCRTQYRESAAVAAHALAALYHEQGKFDMAFDWYKTAFDFFWKFMENGDAESVQQIADALEEIGAMLQQQGNAGKAQEVVEYAAEIRRKLEEGKEKNERAQEVDFMSDDLTVDGESGTIRSKNERNEKMATKSERELLDRICEKFGKFGFAAELGAGILDNERRRKNRKAVLEMVQDADERHYLPYRMLAHTLAELESFKASARRNQEIQRTKDEMAKRAQAFGMEPEIFLKEFIEVRRLCAQVNELAIEKDAAKREAEKAEPEQPAPVETSEKDGIGIGEFIPFKPEEESEETKQAMKKVRECLGCLGQRERMVLEFRYGLNDGYNRTLEEVGRMFNVSRERIRQIEAKAIKLLRGALRKAEETERYEREVREFFGVAEETDEPKTEDNDEKEEGMKGVQAEKPEEPSVDEWLQLLQKEPQLADQCKCWREFNELDIRELLCVQPQFADKCRLEQLPPAFWADILIAQPQLAGKCPWRHWEGGDWAVLLGARPEFAGSCDWNTLDAEDWASLLRRQPQFARRCPYSKEELKNELDERHTKRPQSDDILDGVRIDI